MYINTMRYYIHRFIFILISNELKYIKNYSISLIISLIISYISKDDSLCYSSLLILNVVHFLISH